MIYPDLNIWYFIKNKQSESVTSRGKNDSTVANDKICGSSEN